MLHFKGDLLKDSSATYILHQVNCRGYFNAGIAKQIRMKYPKAYSEYIEYVKSTDPELLLGTAQIVKVGNISIVNLFGQKDIYPRGVCHTDYEALEGALSHFVQSGVLGHRDKIGVPYRMGCGLAGGDWSVVCDILERVLGGYNVEIWERGW